MLFKCSFCIRLKLFENIATNNKKKHVALLLNKLCTVELKNNCKTIVLWKYEILSFSLYITVYNIYTYFTHSIVVFVIFIKNFEFACGKCCAMHCLQWWLPLNWGWVWSFLGSIPKSIKKNIKLMNKFLCELLLSYNFNNAIILVNFMY